MSRFILQLASIAAGAAVGVVVAVHLAVPPPSQLAQEVTPAPLPRVGSPPITPASIAGAPRATPPEAPPVTAEALPPTDPVEVEASRQARVLEWRERVERRRAEPVDLPWAQETSRRITGELERLSDLSVASVDCRTTACVATLEWPDYHAAEAGWSKVLHEDVHAPCSTEMMLPPPDSPNARYRMEAVYVCNR